MNDIIGRAVYRLMEQLDGERGEHLHLITYKTAQGIKVFVLRYLIQ